MLVYQLMLCRFCACFWYQWLWFRVILKSIVIPRKSIRSIVTGWKWWSASLELLGIFCLFSLVFFFIFSFLHFSSFSIFFYFFLFLKFGPFLSSVFIFAVFFYLFPSFHIFSFILVYLFLFLRLSKNPIKCRNWSTAKPIRSLFRFTRKSHTQWLLRNESSVHTEAQHDLTVFH